MSIDPIRGASSLPIAPSTTGASPATTGATAPQAPFQIGGPEAPAATVPNEALTTSPLARLRNGEIGLEEYLDLKVDAATAHIARLPKADLEFVKQSLRERMMTDPSLQNYIEQASGISVATRDE